MGLLLVWRNQPPTYCCYINAFLGRLRDHSRRHHEGLRIQWINTHNSLRNLRKECYSLWSLCWNDMTTLADYTTTTLNGVKALEVLALITLLLVCDVDVRSQVLSL